MQANGTPVADATVDLKLRGASTKTGADGSFAFSGNVALGPVTGLPFQYRLDPHFLSIELPGPQDLRIEIGTALADCRATSPAVWRKDTTA